MVGCMCQKKNHLERKAVGRKEAVNMLVVKQKRKKENKIMYIHKAVPRGRQSDR
jgi:hypothetical protein